MKTPQVKDCLGGLALVKDLVLLVTDCYVRRALLAKTATKCHCERRKAERSDKGREGAGEVPR